MSLLIAASKNDRNKIRKFLSWQPLVFIGTFAYSIYLIHAPIIQLTWQYIFHPLHLGSRTTFLLLIIFGAPLILALSYLFFLVFERPFMTNTQRKETLPELAHEAAISPAP